MKKFSKILLSMSLGAAALSSLPLAMVSCDNGLKRHPLAPNEFVADIKTNSDFKLPEGQKPLTMVTITDGGELNDKSFNQSPWEAVNLMAEQFKMPFNEYTAIKVQNDQFQQAYERALNEGFKVWVLPGFKHIEPMKAFYEKNSAAMKEKGITLVALDFDLAACGIPKNTGIGVSLQYKTKEAAFMAGYAAAEFLSQYSNKQERTVGAFGGFPSSPVTDFIEGFYKGIYTWNSKQTDPNKLVTTVSNGNVALNSGFDPSNTTMDDTIAQVLGKNPKMVLPVAGFATQKTISHKLWGNNKYIIGVDTDTSLKVAKDVDKFFTSILKQLGQSTYDVLGSLQTGVDAQKYITGFQKGSMDALEFKGYSEKWVNVAPTQVNSDLARTALQNGINAYVSLSAEEKAWLESGKVAMNGEEVADLQTRMNQLSSAINAQTAKAS